MREIHITLGDLRRSSSYTSHTNCPLALCTKRQIEGATHVSVSTIYEGDPELEDRTPELGRVSPPYWAHHYNEDIDFMNDPKSEDLPDMHIVRTLQYLTN